jgi:putative SOS response-associated peptidase YedK
MCGKFTQMMSWSDLVALMRGLERRGDQDGSPGGGGEGSESGGDDRVETATPMRMARIIALDETGERQLVAMRWGFVAPWEPKKIIVHARCETIDTLRSFKDAFARRRGILVCRTFNEGQEVGSKTRQFVVSPKDGKPIAIAVIYQQASEPGGAAFWTFAMVTTPPNRLIGTITDRMPAVLQPHQWAKWLGEEPATPDELKAMLTPFEGDWEMAPQEPTKPPRPPKPPRGPRATDKPPMPDLFDPS